MNNAVDVSNDQGSARLGSSDGTLGFREHLTFFDENGDRRISIRETQKGLERLGLGLLSSVPATFAVHFGVAGLGLLQGRRVDPLELSVPDTNRIRHPDTHFVNDAGEFDEARVTDLFARYGHEFAGEALTMLELAELLSASLIDKAPSIGQALWRLPTGLTAGLTEWGFLAWVAGQKRNGKLVLEKETVVRFYKDPRLLHDLARQIADAREQRSHTLAGSARNLIQDWLL